MTNQPRQDGFPMPFARCLTTKAALPRDGGSFDLLLRLKVAFPDAGLDRPPLQLALVIDRSGSMSGAPLDAAKEAAERAVGMLLPGDRVAVVSYDHQVRVDVPLSLVGGADGEVGDGREAIVRAIRAIGAGGTTALHAGWAEGVTQVLSQVDPAALMRVVLLSDGLANVGVRDAATIARDVAEATQHGVTTSALGLGLRYDEDLLRAVADAGQGNYFFIEDAGQVVEVFQQELAGLSALRGRRLRLGALQPGVLLRHVASGMVHDQDGLALPDLVAGLGSETLLSVQMTPTTTPPTLLLSWDDVLSGQREELRLSLDLPLLQAAELDALPLEAEVIQARRLLELSEFKDSFRAATLARDLVKARSQVKAASAVVAAMPAGPERRREAEELERLSGMLEKRDLERATRFAGQVAYAHRVSRKDEELKSMAASEAIWREAKTKAVAKMEASLGDAVTQPVPPAPRAGAVPARNAIVGKLLFETGVPRADGGVTRIEVVQGDLTDQPLDAIVNSTNRGLFGSSGVDGAIHRRGGPSLTRASRALGEIDYGSAVFTPGFDLPAGFVIHTATLPWRGGGSRELTVLRRCYLSSLDLAERIGAKSVGLPAIGTGAYGYPMVESAQVAVDAVLDYLRHHQIELVRLVLLDAAQGIDYHRAWAAATVAEALAAR